MNFEKEPILDFLGIEITKVEKDTAEGKIVFKKEQSDLLGHMPGAIYNALCDAVGGALARSSGDIYVTQNASMQYYVSTEEGTLYARAKVRHRGQRTCIVAVTLFHEDGTIVSDGQLSYSKV